MLQCAGEYLLRILQVDVCCSVLQCGAVCGLVSAENWAGRYVLQCVAACRSVLQLEGEYPLKNGQVHVCCSVLQCVAVWCSVLQRVAVCCSVLQCAD